MPGKRVSLKGKGADLFFGGNQPAGADAQRADQDQMEGSLPDVANQPSAPDLPHPPDEEVSPTEPAPTREAEAQRTPSEAMTSASEPVSYRASMLASNDAGIEAIRRVVRHTGREVSFVRLSPEEKGRLADIVYTYRRQGLKTTENEINRIAINALLEDYNTNGAESLLARVLAALHT
jgi:hypothetical protein